MTSPGTAAPVRKGVIFDMDGVLTDSEPLINAAAVAMFNELGVTVRPEDFEPFVGTGENRYLGGVAELHGVPIDLPAAKRRTYEIYLEMVPIRLRAFPGAVEFVRQCRAAGLKLALASSADRVKIDANLRHIGLPPEFWDAVITGEDVANKKPAPDIFLTAAGRLGLSPAECTVVEDAVNGVQAAKAAGMGCVAVTQTFPADQLRRADRVRTAMAELTLADVLEHPAAPGAPGSESEAESPPLLGPTDGSARRPVGPWGFWATVGLSVVVGVGYLIGQFAGGLVGGLVAAILDRDDLLRTPSGSLSGYLWGVATVGATPLVLGLIWFFVRLRRSLTVREYLGLRRIGWRRTMRWCGLLLVLIPLVDLGTWLLRRPIVPEVMVEAYRTAGFEPLFWFALVAMAPVVEELFFRGFVFRGLIGSRVGAWPTILLTSAAWTVGHGQYDAYALVIVFLGGLLLGYARLRTGSVYPCLAMHALMNLIATGEVAVIVHVLD